MNLTARVESEDYKKEHQCIACDMRFMPQELNYLCFNNL